MLIILCAHRKPAVIMIVGVNGGGKTTSLGMFDDSRSYILFFVGESSS